MSEPLIALLATLASARPDAVRAEQIRTRCRARLARRVPEAVASPVRITPLSQPLLTVLGVAYLTAAIVEALSVLRLYS
jgi:hypothetical protein